TRAFVEATVREPFELAEADRGFSLAPGEKRVVHISASPHGSRAARTLLTFVAGEEQLQLPVQIEGVAEEPSPRATIVPTTFAAAQAPAAAPEEVWSNVPPVHAWSIAAVTANSAEIHWQAPADGPLRYVIEQRRLSLDAADNLVIEWMPQ